MTSCNSVFNAVQTADPAMAIYRGLSYVSQSVAHIAERVRTNPSALGSIVESGRSVGQQLTDIIYDAEKVAEGSESLRQKTAEAAKTADWIGEQNNGGDGNQCAAHNSFGMPVFNSFQELPRQ